MAQWVRTTLTFWMLVVGSALALGCRGSEAELVPITASASPRSDGNLDLVFEAPHLDAADPAISVEPPTALVRATVRERSAPPDEVRRGVILLRPDEDVAPVTLTIRWPKMVALDRVAAGSASAILVAAYRAELPAAGVAFAIACAGALLLACFGLRRDAGYGWLAVFAIGVATTTFTQLPRTRALFDVEQSTWRLLHSFAVFAYPMGLLQFARTQFGDTPRGWLRRLGGLLAALFALSLALHATGLSTIYVTRRLVYPLVFAMVFAGGAVIVPRARSGERAAQIFLAGLLVLVLIALPDLLWGMGFRVLRGYTAHYGLLVFVAALALVLDVRYREQRRALAASTDALEQRVADLEAHRLENESLNDELRHQIERRSRELGARLAELGAAPVPPAALGPGSVVDGRYRIVRFLGEGAMGTVYEALRTTDDRALALKVMARMADSAQAVRFAREAEVAAAVRHPNLVAVIDFGVADARVLYLVMELVRGRTLEAARDRFGDARWALPLLAQIASGLAALHDRAVVHRDLKPGNVLLEAGGDGREHAKIADFGVACFARETAPPETAIPPRDGETLPFRETQAGRPKLTATGAIVGTPLYVAPECAWGAPARAGADVFALGLIAHELLTGRYPFPYPPALLALTDQTIPRPSLEGASGVSHDVAARLEAMLDPDPAARPTAAELADLFGRGEPPPPTLRSGASESAQRDFGGPRTPSSRPRGL